MRSTADYNKWFPNAGPWWDSDNYYLAAPFGNNQSDMNEVSYFSYECNLDNSVVDKWNTINNAGYRPVVKLNSDAKILKKGRKLLCEYWWCKLIKYY